MKNKNWIMFIIVAVLALVVLGFSWWYDRNGSHTQIPEVPTTERPIDRYWEEEPTETPTSSDNANADANKVVAPDFTVYDLEGNEVHLSDFIGKPVVLNFWASWCGPCKNEMPDFHWKYLEYEGEVQFLMINLTDGNKETLESASDYVQSKGYTFPVFYDQDSQAAAAYGIQSIPTTFFIDAEGYAIAQATGSIDQETLQKGIDMILPEQAEETETDPSDSAE